MQPEIVVQMPSKGLKRVPIKRKPRTLTHSSLQKSKAATGRTKPKKNSPAKEMRKLKEELWKLCKVIIRTTYGNTCYTCGASNLSGGNWHTGHFIPSSVCGAYLRYDLRNLRPQCFRCNISLVGNGSSFYRNLVHLEGQHYVDELFADKQRMTKMTKDFLSEKVSAYQEKLRVMGITP